MAPWRCVVPQVLVVDDDWNIAEVMIYLLESQGYATKYASNGKVALEKLLQEPMALVLTDYMMPVMDGYELLQTLRTTRETAGVPVVMLSALQEQVVRDKCRSIEVFLRKPVRAEQLLATVGRILEPPGQVGGRRRYPFRFGKAKSVPDRGATLLSLDEAEKNLCLLVDAVGLALCHSSNCKALTSEAEVSLSTDEGWLLVVDTSKDEEVVNTIVIRCLSDLGFARSTSE
jgi:CheY-like chemotaxis protein